MQTQVLDGYLGHLADLLVGYFLVLVEKKQDKHLVGRDLELIPSLRVEFGPKICSAETKLPVKLLSVVEFVKVELGEAAHRSNHFAGHACMVLNRLLLIEGPMSRGQDFHVDFQTCGHGLKHVAVLEILAQLFADLDVLEHHLQFLRVH